MGERHHNEAGNPGAFDRHAAWDYVGGLIDGDGIVLLSPGGQLAGVKCPVYCAPSHVMAVELFWYATDGTGRQLLAAFEDWAREINASQVVLSTVLRHGGDRVGKVLGRAGYTPQETSYAKDIS